MRWALLTPYFSEGWEKQAHKECVNELKRREGVPHHVVRGCMVIDQARAALAELGLEGPAEIFLWADGDIVFDVRQVVEFVERAFASSSSVVGALYAHKRRGSAAVASQFAPVVRELLAYAPGYVPTVGVGFGLVATKREAFERLHLPFVRSPFFVDPIRPFFLPMVRDGVYLQEDYAFTRRVLDVGLEVSTDTEPRLLHEGAFFYGLEDALSPPTSARNVLIRLPAPSPLELDSGPMDRETPHDLEKG
jgi:hypothetical protein